MIRTRDIVIFLAVLFLLLTGIAFTLLTDSTTLLKGVSMTFDLASEEGEPQFNAVAEVTKIDREGNIERLRKALENTETVIVPAPQAVSLTSDDDSASGEESADTTSVDKCVVGDDMASRVRLWPLKDVSFKINGGFRQVVHSEQMMQLTTASTTSESTSEDSILLSLPLLPTMSSLKNCVPSDVVGVALTGALMFNTDAAFYRAYGPDYLIGYARDGFPIYGYYQGEVDQCGGYMHSSGYRYVVSNDTDYIVGCFVAQPATFNSF